MRRTGLALLLLALTTGSAGARQVSQAASAPPLRGEALLAASVPRETVEDVAGGTWWPEPPSFDTRVFQDDPTPQTAVTQTYAELGGKGRISISLYGYGTRDSSALYLNYATLVGDVIEREKPAVGEEHAYYRTILPDRTHVTRLYFVRGRVAVFIQVNTDWSAARIGRLGRPIDAGLQSLAAGTLRPAPVPAAMLARLPSDASAPGRVLGTTLLPAEAWAMIVRNGNRLQLRDTLVRSGNRNFVFRRYLRQGSRQEVVETAVFAFPNAGAAQSFVAPFRAGVGRSPKTALDPGQTGNASAFRYQFTNYELQFAAGRFVGDVFCWAPFSAEPSKACETAARGLAERWYAELSRAN